MPLLTIFTPAYNRKHTICRTYESLLRQTDKDFQWLIIDDGSTDGTKDWVTSLGDGVWKNHLTYDWMGCKTTEESKHCLYSVDIESGTNCIHIDYIYKPNGGLYTGYNVAFDHIDTELCVCIDSDDYLPDNAVETIKSVWERLSQDDKNTIGGIAGLDYDVTNGQPLGGNYSVSDTVAWVQSLRHNADSKFVFQTKLIRQYAPQLGFDGEKDFNPHYMQMQLFDKYPMFIFNENLCWVEYQIGGDSMSQAIFKQYRRSPRSFAKYRLMELRMTKGVSLSRRFSLAAHYISACIFSRDRQWLSNSQDKALVILAIPLGILYNLLIRYKTRK